jgi:Rhodopirellula transposase DDE domain
VDKQLGRAVPYGIYDLANDEGWVSVGDSADTAEFAVNSVRTAQTELETLIAPKGRGSAVKALTRLAPHGRVNYISGIFTGK